MLHGKAAPKVLALLLACAAALPALAQGESEVNRRATAAEWTALSRLPDFSGVWVPNVTDQIAQSTSNTPPWKPDVAAQVKHQEEEEAAGRPFLVLQGCFPHGMPAWMLITHNAFEILLTPGRVTLLGESDGNRMRRIYTDGRGHPEDPDLTFHGHSTGKWEGDALVVDTVGVLPQSFIATTEAVGIPNNGDMRITERFRLVDPDTLHDEMEITAPKVLTKPWKTTRIYHRQRARTYDIVEGVCAQGEYLEEVDPHGNSIYVHKPQNPDGSVGRPGS